MRCRLVLSVLVLSIFLGTGTSRADLMADCRELVKASGSVQAVMLSVNQNIGMSIKAARFEHKGMSDGDAEILRQEMLRGFAESEPELVELLAKVWAAYLSEDEAKALLRLYREPVFKKMVSLQPVIFADATKAGMTWGQEVMKKIGPRLAQRFKQAHPEQAGPQPAR